MPTAKLADRSLFPDLAATAYLNHAAISPPSKPVLQAVADLTGDYARRGLGALMDALAMRDRLRGRLASLINVPANSVGLVPSTTRGLCDIALAIDWRAGERIVVFTGEFPANITPWQQVARTFDLELVFVSLAGFMPGSGGGPERGLAELQRVLPGTRLVAVSHVQFQTGLHMPIQQIVELSHRHGAEVVVDAVQGLGAVPLDATATGIDYLSCGAHKWLMGFEGLGFVYIRPDRMPALKPRTAGWLSHEQPLGFLLAGERGLLSYERPIRQQADFTEGGALNLLGAAALDVAVACILDIGVDAIFSHIQRYHNALEPALVERGFTSLRSPDRGGRSGILTVEPPRGVELLQLHQALGQAGIACSTPDGFLRFAPHWPNDIAREVPQVVAAIDGFLSQQVFRGADVGEELDAAFDFEADAPAQVEVGVKLPQVLANQVGLGPQIVVPEPSAGAFCEAWQVSPKPEPSLGGRVRQAIAYATLAPSIRNCQPWAWQVREGPKQARIELRQRTLEHPLIDPDGRFVRISLGAAVAGFELAAKNLGLELQAQPAAKDGIAAWVAALAPADAPLPAGEQHWLFQCMHKRRTHRGQLAARPPSERLLERLQAMAADQGCGLCLVSGRARNLVAATIAEGFARLDVDEAMRADAKRWHFPAAAPQPVGTAHSPIAASFAHDPGDGELRAAHGGDEILAGSPVLTVLTTPEDGPGAWHQAGMALMHIQLRGRVDHLWMSPLNAPLFEPSLRRRLATISGGVPQMVLRMGHGGDVAQQPRLGVDRVLTMIDG